MTRKRFLTLILFIFLLAACQSEQRSEAVAIYGLTEPESSMASGEERADGSSSSSNDDFGADPTTADITQTNFDQSQQPESQERLIIRSGNIDLVVEDTEVSLVEIGRLAEQLGGWVVTSEVRQTTQEAKAGAITLRVPADKFDELVSEIKVMAVDVTWESTNSQDVTDEFVDLSSRLGNLEATAERVRAFLDSADNVEEALAVNQELSRLEEEIELIKGRMQYLSQSAAFSSLTVSLTPDSVSQPIVVGGWHPEGKAKDAIETLVRTLQGVADFAIVVGLYFLPLVLLFGLPAYFLIRTGRNWLRRRSEPQAIAAAD